MTCSIPVTAQAAKKHQHGTWESFKDLLKSRGIRGQVLQQAHTTAQKCVDRWVPSRPVLGVGQWVRGLVGLRMSTFEPQLAFRQDRVTREIEMAVAEKVLTARQLKPRWRDIVRPTIKLEFFYW